MQDNLNRFGLVALATDLTIEGDAASLMPPLVPSSSTLGPPPFMRPERRRFDGSRSLSI